MHVEAYKNCELFMDRWVMPTYSGRDAVIFDIGARIAHDGLPNCLRPIFSRPDQPKWRYYGVDVLPGRNVDIVKDDSYKPVPSSADVVVSSSCFEHEAHFWKLFSELVDLLKPGGLLWIDAPSTGPSHWGLDCWRFLPDAWASLASWDHRVRLLESFAGKDAARHGGFASETWNDSVGIYTRLP